MSFDITTLVPYKIHLVTKLKRHLADREMKKLGLSRVQWQTLGWLNILGLPCSQQTLLKATEFDRAHLARILDKLEKDGIIERTATENDRRSLEIHLTKAGKTLIGKVEKIIAHEHEVMTKDFSAAEKKSLDKLLNKLTENLKEELAE